MSLLLFCFVILLILGMPIAFVIGIAGMAFFLQNADIPFTIAVQRVVTQTQSFAFLAVPFFIFAGNLMNEAGITRRLLGMASLLTRSMYGGTAQITAVLSTMMGGVSGSATADAAMQTRILGPEMLKRGYSKGYIASVCCMTGLITATIPPSLGLILYGFIGEVSIGRLFAAGLIPGIVMMIVMMSTIAITTRIKGYDAPVAGVKPPTLPEIAVNLKDSIWALLFPIILIVGIRFGLFTPSEAGAFAVVYAMFIGKFVYKDLSFAGFVRALKMSLRDNGAIMLIIALSGPFSYAITYVKAPVLFSNFIFSLSSNPEILMIIMLAFLFISGMFVDSNVNFLLLTPIFLPMILKVGGDPVHFGVLMATIVTLGVMTPPVGSALYTVCGILDCPTEEYTVAALPFFFAIFAEMVVLVFFPEIVLWIPNMIFGVM